MGKLRPGEGMGGNVDIVGHQGNSLERAGLPLTSKGVFLNALFLNYRTPIYNVPIRFILKTSSKHSVVCKTNGKQKSSS